ncbi:MAG: hypothetical protein KIH06_07560, partial [Kiritimatiellae bacterium]|nr:hypothetical protein [Kiritimatiellia bacterium]
VEVEALSASACARPSAGAYLFVDSAFSLTTTDRKAQMLFCSDAQMLRCSFAQMLFCSDALLLRCSFAQMPRSVKTALAVLTDRVRRYCFFGAVFGIIHANLRLSQEVFPVVGALIVGA